MPFWFDHWMRDSPLATMVDSQLHSQLLIRDAWENGGWKIDLLYSLPIGAQCTFV